MTTVLYLAANPLNTERLRLEEEVRAIDSVLRRSNHYDTIDFQPHLAVRISDLQDLLLHYEPEIVQFSGHGSNDMGIVLQDDQGNSVTVASDALVHLFGMFKTCIQCVVLAACSTTKQAFDIAQHIESVIGMSGNISDTAALEFSKAFYRALGYGRDIEEAFEFGRSEIYLNNSREHHIPKLVSNRSQSTDKQIYKPKLFFEHRYHTHKAHKDILSTNVPIDYELYPQDSSYSRNTMQRSQIFVGRVSELEKLSQIMNDSISRFLFLSGKQGTGKTTLLKHFIRINSFRAMHIYVDKDSRSISRILNEIVEQLEVYGIKTRKWKRIYKQMYAVNPHERLIDPLAEFGHSSSDNYQPIQNSEMQGNPSLDADISKHLRSIAQTNFSSSYTNSEALLIDLLFELMDDETNLPLVILIFDSFDQYPKANQQRVITFILDFLKNTRANNKVIVVGRNYESTFGQLYLLNHLKLEEFTFEEARALLSYYSVVDEKKHKDYYDTSNGSPLYLSVLANLGSQTDVRASHSLIELTLDSCEPVQKVVIYNWAVPRKLTEELIFDTVEDIFYTPSLAFYSQKPFIIEDTLSWFINLPFVSWDLMNKWSINPQLRSEIIKVYKSGNPLKYSQSQKLFADYYLHLATEMGYSSPSQWDTFADWWGFYLEYIYHEIAAQPNSKHADLILDFVYIITHTLHKEYFIQTVPIVEWANTVLDALSESVSEGDLWILSHTIINSLDLPMNESFMENPKFWEILQQVTTSHQVAEIKAVIHLCLGTSLFAVKKYDDAIKILEEGLAFNVPSLEAVFYQSISLIYLKINNLSKAVDSVSVAIAKDPTNTALLYHRALFNLGRDEWLSVVQDMNIVVTKLQNDYMVYSIRGFAKKQLNDLLGAVEDFKVAKSLYKIESNIFKVKERSVFQFLKGIFTLNDIHNDFLSAYLNGVLNEITLLNFLSECYLELNQDREAQLTIKAAEVIEPKDRYLRFLKARLLHENKDYLEAIRILDEIIAEDPDYHKARFCRAISNAYLNRIETALLDIEVLIEKDQLAATIFIFRGLLLDEKNEINGALANFEKARKHFPENKSILYWKAWLHNKVNQHHEAVEAATKFLEIDGNDVEALLIREKSLHHLNKFRLSVEDANRAERIKPDQWELYFYRAQSLIQLRDFTEALKDLDKLIDFGFRDSVIYFMKGVAWRSLNQYDHAIADLNEAISILDIQKGDTRLPYYVRAECFMSQYRFSEAVDDLSYFLEGEPFHLHLQGLVMRGMAHLLLENHQLSINDFNRSLNVVERENDDKLTSKIYTFRGQALLKLKERDKAVSDFKKAISLDPEYKMPYEELINICVERKRVTHLISLLEAYLPINPEFLQRFMAEKFYSTVRNHKDLQIFLYKYR